MGMANHLACFCPRYRETHPVDDVVETKLQLAEEVLAGDARTGTCLLEVTLELALENAVYATDLLLLTQLHAVVADFAAAHTMLTGRRLAALKRAFLGIATGALEKELGALPAAEPADWVGAVSYTHLRAHETVLDL